MTTKAQDKFYDTKIREALEIFEQAMHEHILIKNATKKRNNNKPVLCKQMIKLF